MVRESFGLICALVCAHMCAVFFFVVLGVGCLCVQVSMWGNICV